MWKKPNKAEKVQECDATMPDLYSTAGPKKITALIKSTVQQIFFCQLHHPFFQIIFYTLSSSFTTGAGYINC